jgi:hypothetical protein
MFTAAPAASAPAPQLGSSGLAPPILMIFARLRLAARACGACGADPFEAVSLLRR